MSELLQELRVAASCPEGDAEAWKQFYAPKVASVTRHRPAAAKRWSIIVVAWNSAPFVIGCLDHLIAQDGFDRDNAEIILVDNGGLDPVRNELSERVDIEIRMTENVKLTPARNVGVAYASGPIINFIDDDGLVEADYAENALKYFEDPTVYGVRSKIIAKEHPYFTTLGYHYDRGPDPVEDALVTEGSCFLRRDLYMQVGGFGLLSGHEGMELCRRMTLAQTDGKLLYAPDVVMRHDYMDGWSKYFRKSLHYGGIGSIASALHPEVDSFISEASKRRFPKPKRALRLRLANRALRLGRTLLQTYSRLQN